MDVNLGDCILGGLALFIFGGIFLVLLMDVGGDFIRSLKSLRSKEEGSEDSLDDLEYEVRLLMLKYKSEQLKRKLKEEFGIVMVTGDRPDPKKNPDPKESGHNSDESGASETPVSDPSEEIPQ